MSDTLRAKIEVMVRAGASDAEILATHSGNFNHRQRVRYTIGLVRTAVEIAGCVTRRGPWPVSYVRSDGERVFRVGPGHDIPEGSLKAFGFEVAA